jgi:hypothetical protein
MKSRTTFSPRAAATLPQPARPAPTHDDISAYARAHWEKSGRPVGRDTEIWLEAERRLRLGANEDALADTRAILGESTGSIEDRLEPFGDSPAARSATSL